MSLVNEALKRARTQAAMQQTGNAPLAHLSRPVAQPKPMVSLPSVLVGAGIGCVLVGIVCGVLFYQARSHAKLAEAAAMSAPVVPPRVSLPAPPPPVAVTVPSPAKPTIVATVTEPKPDTKAASVPPPAPGASALAETTVAKSSPVAPAAAPNPPPAPPSGVVDGKVYLQTIDLPDAPKVKLDGIMWSDKNPLALINGITAAPGDDLGEVTVVAIEQKRVKLTAQGKEFFVRLP
jgi:hypothetical protein